VRSNQLNYAHGLNGLRGTSGLFVASGSEVLPSNPPPRKIAECRHRVHAQAAGLSSPSPRTVYFLPEPYSHGTLAQLCKHCVKSHFTCPRQTVCPLFDQLHTPIVAPDRGNLVASGARNVSDPTVWRYQYLLRQSWHLDRPHHPHGRDINHRNFIRARDRNR
jgi:hypothetical protein